MKSWNRIAILLLAALVALPAAFGAPKEYNLTVLSTNDTHGQPLPFAFSAPLALAALALGQRVVDAAALSGPSNSLNLGGPSGRIAAGHGDDGNHALLGTQTAVLV